MRPARVYGVTEALTLTLALTLTEVRRAWLYGVTEAPRRAR